MSDTPNSIRIALALGVLVTVAGVATLVTGNDDEAELVAAATEEAVPAKKAPKRTTSAGAWGLDNSDVEEGEPERKADAPTAGEDDGGWGIGGGEPSPSPEASAPSRDRSDYSDIDDAGQRPAPEVPNDIPEGAGDRVEDLDNS